MQCRHDRNVTRPCSASCREVGACMRDVEVSVTDPLVRRTPSENSGSGPGRFDSTTTSSTASPATAIINTHQR
jgi:hypothetical protein